MKPTVLVVGGRSSLGHALSARLRETMTVTTAGRQGCDMPLDLRWPVERMQVPTGVDVVVHLAAHFPGSSVSELVDAITVNGAGTARLCASAAAAGVKHFLYVSSIFALAGPGMPGYGAYGVSKRLGEDAARLVCDASGVPLAILRPSAMYGRSPRLRAHQPFLYRMLDLARQGSDITLFGKHDPRRNYVHVDDVARAVAALLEHGSTGTFACQHPRDVTYGEVARTAFSIVGKGGQLVFDSDKPDIPDIVFPMDDALRDATGFIPVIDLTQGLRDIAEWP